MRKTFVLANGHEIPAIGFGTWQTPNGDVAKSAVLKALEVGYRHIDTATFYGNEESVGEAIQASGLPRESLFVTSKLWNDVRGYDETLQAIKDALKRLKLEYLDLYLIHWPNPNAYRDDWEQANSESWRAMEDAYNQGLLKAIGVSNFRVHHLEALLKTARIKPMVNQIFYNPSDTQDEVVKYNTQHDMITEAYSPLGTGKIFAITELQTIAEKYNKTVAQVVLRWILQNNVIPLPKSVTPERIVENFDIFDFELSDDDMELIRSFKGMAGSAMDPDTTEY